MATHDDQSGGQKTFRLARLFHTEDCYRARGLTAEDLVRRTFIGVDADTFRKLDRRQRSYYDVTNCEDWLGAFGGRLQDEPTCRDIGDAAERLGYSVRKFQGRDREHFYFHGVRVLDYRGYTVEAQCAGCDCQCDHAPERLGTGCESCDCACEGCYCAASCVVGHPGVVDDTEDPLMNLAATDANLSYRSRRFALNRDKDYNTRWHTDDCKFLRSFTADELVRLTMEPRSRGKAGGVSYDEWLGRYERYFNSVPDARELEDALKRTGTPGFGGVNLVDATGDVFDVFWLRRPFRVRGCGAHPCDCLCKLCGPGGCTECDCQCKGCFCTGTCAEGHPIVPRESDLGLLQAWRTLAGDWDTKRYEREYGVSWHALDCTAARWLTADQIVNLTLRPPAVEIDGVEGYPCDATRPGPLKSICGFYWIHEWPMRLDRHPSCRELAAAARRAGIRVTILPRRWPWVRTHYALVAGGVGYSVVDGADYRAKTLTPDPSCASCECFCASCDDCSKCGCECAGCICSARCSTGECVVHELSTAMMRPISKIERRLGTKKSMSPGDLEVSNALVRLEREAETKGRPEVEAGRDSSPTFKLLAKGDWHQYEAKAGECEHSSMSTLTAIELVYATLTPLAVTSYRRRDQYSVTPAHADCEDWRNRSKGLIAHAPSCEQLAAAATRLGYQVKPVEGVRSRQMYDHETEGSKAQGSNERQVHYEFPNAAYDPRLVSQAGLYMKQNFIGCGRWDEERCNGKCECGCRHFGVIDFDLSCECAGCYCRRTCVPARTAE